jgi:RNA polymerase sigma factor (sigma-70 family)
MRPESEDVLHDALIKALGKMSQFKQKGSLEGWLKRIAMTTSLDYLNKQKHVVSNSQTLSLEIEETKAEEEEEDVGFMTDLKKHNIGSKEIFFAMDNLPDGYRAILNMYVVDNIRHKEIAKRMGISVNTSKSQLSRARKLLKKNISDMMKGEKHVR